MKPSRGSVKSAENAVSSLEVDMDALAKGIVSPGVPFKVMSPYQMRDQLTKADRMEEWGEGYYGFKREQIKRFNDEIEVLHDEQASERGGD